MQVKPIDPPRTFAVGSRAAIRISHAADISLEPDEQVTFVTASGTQYDVVRKSWGYYATPSINGRLRDHGLRAALVVNEANRLYLMLVERDQEAGFEQYLRDERQKLVTWLDEDAEVARLLGPYDIGESRDADESNA